MASTIKNFLVGIGYDYDNKGEKQIESGIDSIKSKALQLGAVVAGAFGIKALTSDFAEAKDELGKFSQVFGVTANDVFAFGQALEHEGGSLEGFMSQLQNLEKLRAGLIQGDAAFIAQAERAGIDADVIINAENATEAYRLLADEFAKLDPQARINAANALGLDEASIRLLSLGTDELDKIIERMKKVRPVTEDMTDAARDWNDQTQDLGNNIGSFGDRISAKLLPPLNETLSGMNQWIEANKGLINQGIDQTFDVVADNLGLISGTLGIIAGSAAFGMLFKFGRLIPIFGGLAAGVGAMGMALMSWAAAAFAAWHIGQKIGESINDQLSDEQKMDVGRFVAKGMAFFGNERAQMILDQERENRNRANGGGGGDIPQAPMVINAPLMLDGNVLSDHTIKVMDKEFNKAQQDLTSSTGG